MNRARQIIRYRRLIIATAVVWGISLSALVMLPFIFSESDTIKLVSSMSIAFGLYALIVYYNYLTHRLQVLTEETTINACLDKFNRLSGYRPDQLKNGPDSLSKVTQTIDWIEEKINDYELDASKATLKAERAKFAQERFLRTVSEDIRAPLLNIMTGIRALLESRMDPEDQIKLERIQSSSFRLMSSINDALEIGGTSGKYQYRSVNLSQLAQDLSEVFSYASSTRPEVVVSFLVDHRLPHSIKADPRKLMHLMSNLVENSLRFTDHGIIELIVSTNTPDVSKGKICKISITCSDTGSGITKEKAQAINSELSGALLPPEESELGLGLRASLKILSQIGGGLEVFPTLNGRTRVVAELKAEVTIEPKEYTYFPHNLKFFTSTNETFVAISNIGYYHGISPLPVNDPLKDEGSDTLFIDATDLFSGELGNISEIKNPNRIAVILDHKQKRNREKLIELGFKRFISLPLTSGAVLQCLLGEDGVISGKPKLDMIQGQQGLNVLVVDDVETTRLRISEHLKSSNHKVTEASDGLELVELLTRDHNFDIVFCDITMAHLDGIEAVQKVREYEKSKGAYTPIVAMTAYSVVDEPEALSKAGFDATLKKPVYLDELDFLIGKVSPINPVNSVENVAVNVAESKNNVESSANTQFIDLDDLRKRSAGKTRIMVQVLDSFIETSKNHLNELAKIGTKDEAVLMARCIHTIKGLLLEAGAVESAHKLSSYEEQLRSTSTLAEDDLYVIQSLVDDVCAEATELRKQLQ